MPFEAIAVVGRACTLPDAHSPEELWNNVSRGRDSVRPAPEHRWGLRASLSLGSHAESANKSWSDAGGYVSEFESLFDPSGFGLPETEVLALDRVFRWTLHGVRRALMEAGLHGDPLRGGLVLGNLSFPTEGMYRYAESVWLRDSGIGPAVGAMLAKRAPVDPRERFMSGLPASLAARANGLQLGGFAVDAACASSLYAIKLACDRLHAREAEVMVAGAVNAADDLFLHIGFSALGAISQSGQSRPFHREADGLVPAEGAGFVVLQRLEDAVRQGKRIYGVIRAVGLSNDGRGRGLLAPSEEGQRRAIASAYSMSKLSPRDIGLVECHATGTPVGDATEVHSMSQVFQGCEGLPIGSLKGNLGHLITAAGVAALLKVMAAMEARVAPASLHSEAPMEALEHSPFRLLQHPEVWQGPRRAAVSAFGFGGNNAHLLVESYDSSIIDYKTPSRSAVKVAVVALGARVGAGDSLGDFTRALLSPGSDSGAREAVCVSTEGLKFPPRDLGQTLSQQLLVLEAAREATQGITLPKARTMVLVGMETDPAVARYGARWRIAEHAREWSRALGTRLSSEWVHKAREAIVPRLEAAGVLGTMPNLVANRLSSQLDAGGPGFALSAEEASGIVGVHIAAYALRALEVDMALVGATDLSHDPVHREALSALGSDHPPGDGAVVLVLERESDARAQGHPVLAILSDNNPSALEVDTRSTFGSAHAAKGLVDLSAAVVNLYHRVRPNTLAPWMGPASARVSLEALGGLRASCTLSAADSRGVMTDLAPRFHVFSGADREGALRSLDARRESDEGPARLVLVASTEEELHERALQCRLWMLSGGPQPEGVAFRELPLQGEVSFVFTGAASAYAGMSRDLCLAVPQLVARLAERSPAIVDHTRWVFQSEAPAHPLDQLWGASFVCQLHAMLSLEVMALAPTAVLGYSSGESNSLFAMGAWRDLDAMVRACDQSPLFRTELVGDFNAPRRRWSREGITPTGWASFCVAAPVASVREALSPEPLAHLTIINTKDDCVIAGESSACHRVISSLGTSRAIPLGYDMAAHCPEVAEVHKAWWELHHRECFPVPSVRFYTHATCQSYVPTSESAAEAITTQALDTLDFPRLVEAAWRDGVRVFIEHGPRGRCTQWIKAILGEREHLAVALDVQGRGAIKQLMSAAATLLAAGVSLNRNALESMFSTAAISAPAARGLRFAAHLPEVRLMPFETPAETLPEAPELPPILDLGESVTLDTPSPESSLTVFEATSPRYIPSVFTELVGFQSRVSEIHSDYLHSQSALHSRFIDLQRASLDQLLGSYARVNLSPQPPLPVGRGGVRVGISSSFSPSPDRERGLGAEVSRPGPKFTRAQLETLASGKISSVFGPGFAAQDGYVRQVRMPEAPLLLADRVTGIDAEALSMRTGTLWTETDVTRESWYLDHAGRMPAGIMIEAGQADLLLISWLGIDMLNKGERVYRLLGCELTYHGELPKPGDTLEYEIHIDGHASQGEVRLFFFHYECTVRGELRLSVRHGQAGFFTDNELANSAGVLWSASDETLDPSLPHDPPALRCTKSSLSAQDLTHFSQGQTATCFGEGFGFAETHVRSAHITPGEMLFVHRVSEMNPEGGPWARGYLRAEADLAASDWFLRGHFKNDPCMPGTLMFEGCLQAMAVYITSLGFTLTRDGWRFEIVSDQPYPMRCRGQCTPESRLLVYEVFVRALHAGDQPTVFADLLCTVDGRKAFHARNVGLRLVPDWPLEDWRSRDIHRELTHHGSLPLRSLGGLAGYTEPRGVATSGEFLFNYDSLLACAWGRPSGAFGSFYSRFDSFRRVARLPGPPYHFMSRVTSVDSPIGQLKPGAHIEVEYDIPQEAWYFHENGHPVMPFCVLMEAALQPCGWLASYVGSACASDTDLLFRNLDGTGTQLGDIKPGARLLTTRVKITNISQSAGMIIESFEVRCSLDGSPIYSMNTVFGYFPPEAFENQVGLPVSELDRARVNAHSSYLVDLSSRPPRYTLSMPRLARPMLLMLDRVTGYWPEGGPASLGYLRGEKDVDVTEWFFKAHFFQDPVQPGSLGVEALCQLLQFYMLERDMAEGISGARFEPIMLGRPVTWKYRGQVVPKNKIITSEIEILEVGKDPIGPFAIANGWLWVDGKRIYSLTKFGMRIHSTQTEDTPETQALSTVCHLDPSVDTWLRDHRPTWTLPALPMMSMVDILVTEAERRGAAVSSLTEVQILRWLPLPPGRVSLRTESQSSPEGTRVSLLGWREALDPKLSRFEPIATALAHTKLHTVPSPTDTLVGEDIPSPYESGALFHGPAFHYLTHWTLGVQGASGTLRAELGSVPRGRLHQGLLDAATHVIPHDELWRWSEHIPRDTVGYPYRLRSLNLHRPLPDTGELRVEARFQGFDGDPRFPRIGLTLLDDSGVFISMSLVEILLPKGPIGAAPRALRRAFLRDRAPDTKITLSTLSPEETVLAEATVRQSDWLPGNIDFIYKLTPAERSDPTLAVALREHIARRSFVHPSTISISQDSLSGVASVRPLRAHPLVYTRAEGVVRVRDHGAPRHELSPVFSWWRERFGLGPWIIEDLYRGLISRFIGDVVLQDPLAFKLLRGRPCLYLANHQVGVESILFSTVVSALSNTPTLTLAKAEHRESWIGALLAQSFNYPGSRDMGVIRFFEREDREALMEIITELGEAMKEGRKSVMVHVEGTRGLSARQPVAKMTSAFIDMALAVNAPIVPVKFVGGLPVEPLSARLEFPVGWGRQDYWLGAPISPEELRSLALKERKTRVIDAINGLGPPHSEESPFEGDPGLGDAVSKWTRSTHASEPCATLIASLMDVRDPCPETLALRDALASGELDARPDEISRWLHGFTQWLRGDLAR